MQLTVLVDNNTIIDRYFLAEPALSFLIEENNNSNTSLCLADDPAAGTEQLSLPDLNFKPPAYPVLVTGQDLTGSDLVILKQLLLTGGTFGGQHFGSTSFSDILNRPATCRSSSCSFWA